MIEVISDKLKRLDFYDNVLKYLYIPIYRTYSSQNMPLIPFINIYTPHFVVKQIDFIPKGYYSKGIFVN
jgi:hypothetical protein